MSATAAEIGITKKSAEETVVEKEELLDAAPGLGNLTSFTIIGDQRATFNCFAHAVGVDNKVLQYSNSTAGRKVYEDLGFTITTLPAAPNDAEIYTASVGGTGAAAKHAHKNVDGGNAESKCGPGGWLIRHPHAGLSGSRYGNLNPGLRYRKTGEPKGRKPPRDRTAVPAKDNTGSSTGDKRKKEPSPTEIEQRKKVTAAQQGTATTHTSVPHNNPQSHQVPAKSSPATTNPTPAAKPTSHPATAKPTLHPAAKPVSPHPAPAKPNPPTAKPASHAAPVKSTPPSVKKPAPHVAPAKPTPHPAAKPASHPTPAKPAAKPAAKPVAKPVIKPSKPLPTRSKPIPKVTAPKTARRGMTRHFVVNHEALPPMDDPYEPTPLKLPESVAGVTALHADIKEAFPSHVESFDALFEQWKGTWYTGENKYSSNPEDRAKGPEYDALVKLGPKIIPLVVHKLLDEETNWPCVFLYEAVEEDDGAKVNTDNSLDRAFMQRHANLIVDINHQRNTAFNERKETWKEDKIENSLSPHSEDYTSGEGYEAVTGLGSGVVGNMMVEYNKTPDEWWHEALHEVVHGEKAGPGTFIKDQLYEDWKKWYEEKEHHEAPKGL